MPYASDKQRKFMHAQHPEIAKRWDAEMQSTPGNATPKLPERQTPNNRGRTPTFVKGTPQRSKSSMRQKVLKKRLGGLPPYQQR